MARLTEETVRRLKEDAYGKGHRTPPGLAAAGRVYNRGSRLGGLAIPALESAGKVFVEGSINPTGVMFPGKSPGLDPLKDIKRYPQAFRAFTEQARQGEGWDIDAGIPAAQDVFDKPWGYFAGAEIAAELMATGGTSALGTALKTAARAPGAFSRFGRGAGAARAAAETVGTTAQVPWYILERIPEAGLRAGATGAWRGTKKVAPEFADFLEKTARKIPGVPAATVRAMPFDEPDQAFTQGQFGDMLGRDIGQLDIDFDEAAWQRALSEAQEMDTYRFRSDLLPGTPDVEEGLPPPVEYDEFIRDFSDELGFPEMQATRLTGEADESAFGQMLDAEGAVPTPDPVTTAPVTPDPARTVTTSARQTAEEIIPEEVIPGLTEEGRMDAIADLKQKRAVLVNELEDLYPKYVDAEMILETAEESLITKPPRGAYISSHMGPTDYTRRMAAKKNLPNPNISSHDYHGKWGVWSDAQVRYLANQVGKNPHDPDWYTDLDPIEVQEIMETLGVGRPGGSPIERVGKNLTQKRNEAYQFRREYKSIQAKIAGIDKTIKNYEKSTVKQTIPSSQEPRLPVRIEGQNENFGAYRPLLESDIDKALWIVRDGRNRSAHDEAYMDWLRQYMPDKSDSEIRYLGGQVKDHIGKVLKGQEVIPTGNWVARSPIAKRLKIQDPERIQKKMPKGQVVQTATLPEDLFTRQSTYGDGRNTYFLKFDSDADKALYELAGGRRKNKRSLSPEVEQGYINFLKPLFPGRSTSQIRKDANKMYETVKRNVTKHTTLNPGKASRNVSIPESGTSKGTVPIPKGSVTAFTPVPLEQSEEAVNLLNPGGTSRIPPKDPPTGVADEFNESEGYDPELIYAWLRDRATAEDIVGIDKGPLVTGQKITWVGSRDGAIFIERLMGSQRKLKNDVSNLVDGGGSKLEEAGLAVKVGKQYQIKEEAYEEVDALFNALHTNNPEGLKPATVGVFDDLSKLRDWSETLAFELDPEMPLRSNYFYRGWKPDPELNKRMKYQEDRGQATTYPGGNHLRPANDASYREMRNAGFEPLFWNPYEQWAVRHMSGQEYRLLTSLKAMLQAVELAEPISPGQVARGGWRTPKVGPAFQGANINGVHIGEVAVPDALANRLELLFQKHDTKTWNIIKDIQYGPLKGKSKEIAYWNVIDRVVYGTKRAKLFGSFFQQADFLFRNYSGSWSAAVDATLSGRPDVAVKHLMHIPEHALAITRSYFSPGYRKQLAAWYRSTESLVAGRPNINPENMVKAGLSQMDPTIFAKGIDATTKQFYKEVSPINPAWAKRILVAVERAMRNALYDGVYPAAMQLELKNNLLPQLIRLNPNATDQQIMTMAARNINKRYSVIPAEQSIIQNRAIREGLNRVFFSFGEGEGLLRQAAGAVRGSQKRYWGSNALGTYLGLMFIAGTMHFVATGKILPKGRFSPVSRSQHSWLPLGLTYNQRFAAPTIGGPDTWIPLEGRGGTELTADLPMQQDTVFRFLSPLKFFTQRESVPVRALQNQIQGQDFFGADVTKVGPMGAYSRGVQLARDLLAPIGIGEGAIELLREQLPVEEGLIAPGMGRLGTGGIGIKALGINVRTASFHEMADRATQDSGLLVEMTDPTIGGLPEIGESATKFEHLTPSQKDSVKRNNLELNEELERRTAEGEIRGQDTSVVRAKKQKLLEGAVSKLERIETEYLSDRTYGANFVPAQARAEIAEILDDYYKEIYGKWDSKTEKMVDGIYDEDFEWETPEKGSKAELLHLYYTRFDSFRAQNKVIDWAKDGEALAEIDAAFWADLSKEDRMFLLQNTKLIERDFPPRIQTHLDAKRYAGAYVGTAGGQQVKYWDLVRSPSVISFIAQTAQVTSRQVTDYLSMSFSEKKAAQREPTGDRIDRAYGQVVSYKGMLSRLRSEFTKNAPEDWKYAMLEAGYSFQGSENLMEGLRMAITRGYPIKNPDYESLYKEEMVAR